MTRYTRFDSLDHAYYNVLTDVLGDGQYVAPRGKATLELLGTSFTIEDASRNVLTIPERRLNYHFSVAEWIWIMLGRKDVRTIARYNKNIAAFSDDGIDFYGAYGPWVRAQLPYVINNLLSDSSSRQAVMTIWQQSPRATKDVPCTIALQFLNRGSRLHAIATMRSNDAWLGLPYDVFNFTQIQAYIAALLDLPVGTYTHQAASLHLYENNWDAARTLTAQPYGLPAIQSPSLTPLPSSLMKAWELLADDATAEHVNPTEFPAPWDVYVTLLRHRSRPKTNLLEPYATLIAERAKL